MVLLENIKKENGKIYCDCFKEGNRNDMFSLILDENSLDILASTEDETSYAKQATSKIYFLLKRSGVLPSSAVYMTH